MYERFVMVALLKDLLLNLSFFAWIPIIYFGFQLYKSEARGWALSLLWLLWGGLALLDLTTKWRYYADYLNYLRLGDGYVLEKTCLIEDAYAPITTALLHAAQYLKCADGTSLVIRHRRDYQRIYPKVGRTFRVRYLPKSGLVLELTLLADGRESIPEGKIHFGPYGNLPALGPGMVQRLSALADGSPRLGAIGRARGAARLAVQVALPQTE